MNAPEVVVYATPTCSYCGAARMLLTQKGVRFTEHVVSRDAQRRAEMEARSGRRTVPQIFIGGTHVGGFDELYALDRSGQLDELLAGSDVRTKTQE